MNNSQNPLDFVLVLDEVESHLCQALKLLYDLTDSPRLARNLALPIINRELTQMSRLHHEIQNNLPCSCPDCQPKPL